MIVSKTYKALAGLAAVANRKPHVSQQRDLRLGGHDVPIARDIVPVRRDPGRAGKLFEQIARDAFY